MCVSNLIFIFNLKHGRSSPKIIEKSKFYPNFKKMFEFEINFEPLNPLKAQSVDGDLGVPLNSTQS